jgi:SAM-dependent methyltransferase
MISGDPEVDFPSHVAWTHLAGRSSLTAIALGCGNGHRTLAWARLGVFDRVDAFDLSAERIAYAKQLAAKHGLGDVVHFSVGDVNELDLDDGSYDVVIGEQSIHHFSPMDRALRLASRLLRPDGWLFLDEYVGPARLQWTDRQVEAASGLVATLPTRLRTTLDGEVKRRCERPSVLYMHYSDPSEAVESNLIRPLIHEIFDVVEEREYGGAVLHLALHGIGHHFRGDDPEAARILESWFLAEDLLMASGDVGSDFLAASCRRR